jgi:hypothetical protein
MKAAACAPEIPPAPMKAIRMGSLGVVAMLIFPFYRECERQGANMPSRETPRNTDENGSISSSLFFKLGALAAWRSFLIRLPANQVVDTYTRRERKRSDAREQ